MDTTVRQPQNQGLRRSRLHLAWLAGIALAAVARLVAAEPSGVADPLTAPRTQWFREARFGMFIHWGLYALPAGVWKGQEVSGAGEWIMNTARIPAEEYARLAGEFNPTRFDADAWAEAAAQAGMRYVVITSKHHDGFCLFDSKLTDYDTVDATPYHRDAMKELAAACRGRGLQFGFYHSILDWHHPDQAANFPRYVHTMKGQLRELLTHYGPIGILWFDGQWIEPWTEPIGRDVAAFCRSLQPGLILNNRVGKGGSTDGDYDTPEQTIPGSASPARLWETCMTMNDTWGYKASDQNWKPTRDLVRKLIDISSKGGNFLLNVGPTAEGVIPGPSLERLRGIGRWLDLHGEAIYGTTASPYQRTPFDGRCTVRGNTLYVHLFSLPAGQQAVELTGLTNRVRRAWMLDSGRGIGVTPYQVGDVVRLEFSGPLPDADATVVGLTMDGPPAVDNRIRAGADGLLRLPAVLATVHGATARYETGGGKDNIGFWTDEKDTVSWDFRATRAGRYQVEITFACEAGIGGSQYAVGVAGQELTGTVTDTGAWTRFVTAPVGTVDLPGAGACTLTVTPRSKPHLAVMNLQAVVLKPVSGAR